MEKNQVVRKKRKLRKGRVFGAIALLLSVIVFGTIQVKDGLANNEKEIVLQEEKGNEIYIKKIEVIEKDNPEEPEYVTQLEYKENISMPKEHQQFLYSKVQERGLDFEKVLALIETESNFQADAIGPTNDYGYFQINEINHEYLAETLSTENDPLNPYINIDWGTYMLSTLYDYWEEEGVSGEELDYHVWSSYNKGIKGFKENGMAVQYVSKIQQNLSE